MTGNGDGLVLRVEMPLAVLVSFFGLSAAQHCSLLVDFGPRIMTTIYPAISPRRVILRCTEMVGRHYFVAVPPSPSCADLTMTINLS